VRLARSTHPRIRGVYACGLAVLLTMAGCATVSPPPPVSGPPPVVDSEAPGGVIARNDRFVLYSPAPEDTLASVARRFLGSEKRQWEIADFNAVSRAEPGKVLAIPLRPTNPQGILPEGYQTVPILCYHRVGPRTSRMVIAPDTFAAQLDYLARNDYRVIRLSDLMDFLEGKGQLPKRAVVITFDDGHISAYEHAYPLLKKYGFPATMFLYTDFVGAKEALNWTQMREMARSGLIDFQPHSKTHSNLVVRLPGETDQHYRERLDVEIRVPRDLIQRNLSTKVTDYAYPYGDANELVLERLAHADYRLGLTVNPGGNAFFANPLMLRRTMIFGEHGMDAFKAALQVFKEVNLR
jgi:peptidoglycan/xylan/chitin deacetylase (PgdA/CDA1 family)